MNLFVCTWKDELKPIFRDWLIDIKLWRMNLESAEKTRDKYIKMARELIDTYDVEPKFEAKNRIVQYAKDLIYNNIKQNEKM